MLNKEVKIVRLNESRYMEDEFGIKTLMLYEDELVEITPISYRMRKKILNTTERKKEDSKK